MKAHFYDVGRDKREWISEIETLDYETLYREVRRSGALLSNEIEFYQEKENEKNIVIEAGFRIVGRIQIEE